MGRLDDKVTIITGGAGGIGKAAARRFIDEGSRVLLVDLDEATLAATVEELGSNQVSWCAADVTREDDTARYIEAAVERYGGVDILLANAGIEGQVAGIMDYDVDVFDKVMAVNVRGVWLGLKSVFPAMIARGGGSIVVTSSVAGVSGAGSMSAYNASKHAVIGLMRSASKEGAGHNIRVNTVNPSPVETRMMRSLEKGMGNQDPEAVHDRIAENIPMKRYAEPHEIASVMLFLASDEASFVTGGVYMADGGSTS